MLEALVIIAVIVLLIPRLIQFGTRRQFMTGKRYTILAVIVFAVIMFALASQGQS